MPPPGQLLRGPIRDTDRENRLSRPAAAHASVHNHFNHDRALERRARFKDLRNAALADWRQLLAA